MSKTRLGVVFGGRSVEHEVSVVSAMELLADADPARFETVPFGVTRSGTWLTPAESRTQLDRVDPLFEKRIDADVPPLGQRPEVIRELTGCDVVFPLIHGVNGEDGTLQGMLEMLGVPYAGCGVGASAIGMDKALQKELFQRAGLRVARYLTVFAREWRDQNDDVARAIDGAVGYPAFVKPSNGGSSVGVSKVRSREDLGEAMRAAFGLDRKVLVEEAVAGRELDCGVIGNDEFEASPVGEVTNTHEFYDYAAKYLDESARIDTPAKISEADAHAVQSAAIAGFRAIDGQGFARIDFFLPKDGTPVINEINTLPGFRPVSMFPALWAAAGVTYRELITRLVDLALRRFGERQAFGA
jgi:D-alanine-D-alanine ligase